MPLALSALFAISCEVYYSVPGCRAELIIGTVHTEIPGPCALFAISWVVVYYSVPGCRAELIIGTSQALDFAGRAGAQPSGYPGSASVALLQSLSELN